MVVVAAIDCGSNSTRLLISEVNNGKLKKIFKTSFFAKSQTFIGVKRNKKHFIFISFNALSSVKVVEIEFA